MTPTTFGSTVGYPSDSLASCPVWEELFIAVNGYLVNHSSSDIFYDTVTFHDPENVDFDVLHVTLLTFCAYYVNCVVALNMA